MERPEWHISDTVRSIRDLGSLVLDTIAELIPINIVIDKTDEPTQED